MRDGDRAAVKGECLCYTLSSCRCNERVVIRQIATLLAVPYFTKEIIVVFVRIAFSLSRKGQRGISVISPYIEFSLILIYTRVSF